MQSPLTIQTDHAGDYDSLFHEFTMFVTSDDGCVDEAWIVKQEISDIDMQEFTTEIFFGDPDSGDQFLASPTDPRVQDEIEALTNDALDTASDLLSPSNPWEEAGVRISDFI